MLKYKIDTYKVSIEEALTAMSTLFTNIPTSRIQSINHQVERCQLIIHGILEKLNLATLSTENALVLQSMSRHIQSIAEGMVQNFSNVHNNYNIFAERYMGIYVQSFNKMKPLIDKISVSASVNIKRALNNKIFVIQPFNDEFNHYYHQCFKPAIETAGFKSVRIDEVLGKDDIFKHIEEEIESSVLCFAEMSSDNPNVWFEIGIAHAKGKKMVRVCKADARSRLSTKDGQSRTTIHYPFDVAGKNIISYTPDTLIELKERLTAEIQAVIKKHATPVTPLQAEKSLKEMIIGFIHEHRSSNQVAHDKSIYTCSMQQIYNKNFASISDVNQALDTLAKDNTISIVGDTVYIFKRLY